MIPPGLVTIPLMRKVSTTSPAFPGGRFTGGSLLGRAFVSSVSKGSRRTIGFSSGPFSAVAPGLAAPGPAAFVASCPWPWSQLELLPWPWRGPLLLFPGLREREPAWEQAPRPAGRSAAVIRRQLDSAGRAPRWVERWDVLAPVCRSQGPPTRPAATGFAMILRVA